MDREYGTMDLERRGARQTVNMELDKLLVGIQKPGRYIGREWNSVRKGWTGDRVKVVLAFPDVYEVGSSYLGMKTLYGILNSKPDLLCERVFAPWLDFEKALREKGAPLFSLESRRPIKDFDIIGISLTYELTYSNVLTILDLGGIPKRSSERKDDDPIIIAGGNACYNPEPMAEFIDAFLIGDGEEAIVDIAEAYKKVKGKGPACRSGRQKVKEEILKEFAKIEGVYVPSLPSKVKKRVVTDFDNAFYPTRQIVPNIQIVHDRIAIEIMRGCKHACRFCQAATTYRPCRERSAEKILELAKASYAMTGYDEISLLSLSSIDHSQIVEIIECLSAEFSGKSVSISVPSLRIGDALKKLPALISKVRKPGLTFAPEVGTECLRKILRKNIDIEELFTAAYESFKKGWRKVKLYFMIGLPGERNEDVLEIANLIYKISDIKRQLDGKPARVTASINAFVPKPHTPFQWEVMETIDELERKKVLLKEAMKSPLVDLDFHSFQMSYVEAVLARGDRRIAGAIYEAWKNGARFDGWQDMFDFDIWIAAFRSVGIDPQLYVNRKKAFDEIEPWDFIDIGMPHKALEKDARAVLERGPFDK